MIDLYRSVRDRTTALAKPISIEAIGMQVATFASPTKWHLAHTTWFFEQFILKKHVPGYKVFSEDFNFLFNSYYETIGKRQARQQRGMLSFPPIDLVWAYRNAVDEAMTLLLKNRSDDAELMKLVRIGLNHEEQHQELLVTDIKYTLGTQTLMPTYGDSVDETCSAGLDGHIQLDEHITLIGADPELDFTFDNEHPRHSELIPAASISTRLVTNGEYLEFMQDGGYDEHRHWFMEAWEWLNDEEINAPLYWFKKDTEWWNYTLNGPQKVDLAAPVCHVSYYEASAFALWANASLLTEAQREAVWGSIPPSGRWEWTNSAYLPYPGYRQPDGAVGEYNGKFMVSQMVLRGASVATAPHHSRASYRNFFYPGQRWQYSGIRLCR